MVDAGDREHPQEVQRDGCPDGEGAGPDPDDPEAAQVQHDEPVSRPVAGEWWRSADMGERLGVVNQDSQIEAEVTRFRRLIDAGPTPK